MRMTPCAPWAGMFIDGSKGANSGINRRWNGCLPLTGPAAGGRFSAGFGVVRYDIFSKISLIGVVFAPLPGGKALQNRASGRGIHHPARRNRAGRGRTTLLYHYLTPLGRGLMPPAVSGHGAYVLFVMWPFFIGFCGPKTRSTIPRAANPRKTTKPAPRNSAMANSMLVCGNKAKALLSIRNER